MHRYKESQTKIIATVGPACSNKEVMRKMILEGVNIFRLNFSHGAHEDHGKVIKTLKELKSELGTHFAILADLQGPKLRIGDIENKSVELVKDATIRLVTEECLGNSNRVYMSYKPFPMDVMPGETILIDDGKLKLEVIETNRKDEVIAKVVNGGTLSSRKGVNLPNTRISLPSLTKKDIADVNYVLDFDIEWVALSFVRSVTDIIDLKGLIRRKKKQTRVIAKIEKPEALKDIDNIIDLADGIMIARGDLGVEVPFDQVPILQKQIASKCIAAAKPVIIATQMMETMIENYRPTRAEANDVANAVVDLADALMLSGETSVGKYPVEVVRSMQKVIDATEGKGFVLKSDNKPEVGTVNYLPDVVCYNACKMADLTGAKGIVVFTYGGTTAYKIASHRPNSKIFAFTQSETAIDQLALAWGVRTFKLNPEASINDAIEHATEILKKHGFVKQDDVLVYVGSIPMRERGKTNNMKIAIVN